MTDTVTDFVEHDIAVLARARGLFDALGWGQDEEVCKDGSVCAIGAVLVALGSRTAWMTHINGEEPFPYLVPPGMTDSPVPPRMGEHPSFEGAKKAWAPRVAWNNQNAKWRESSGFTRIEKILDNAAFETDMAEDIVRFNDSLARDTGKKRVQEVFDNAIQHLHTLKEPVNV